MSVVLRPGWELDNPNNSSVIFKARVPQTLFGVPGGGSKQVEIVNNTSTGNFDFYRVNLIGQRESNPFVSYNASNDIPAIKDLTIYSDFYDTTNGQNQFTKLIKSSKEATLNIAELNAGVDPVNLRNYNTIKAKSGYKSLANAVPAPAPTKQPPPLAPGPGADPSADPSADPGANPQTNAEPFSGAELTTYTDKQGFFADSKAILKYPLNQSSEVYDYIKIQPVEYVAGLKDINDPRAILESVTTRIKNTGIYPTIYLPMTPSISETNSVGWGSDELNPVQAAFGQAAMSAISSAEGGDLMNFVTTTGQGVQSAVSKVTSDPKLSKFISAYFAGQAVQTNLLGRSGIVINPNLELLFQGPKLRSFRYNFRFTPRDDKEAKEIRRIIRVFKKSMAPRRTEGSLFLGVPAVYEIKYIFKGGGDHPFLNKIKPCALTGFNVNYAPDGSYMTYQDGSMTSYTVDMQFDELEPIYNEDISQDLESETMDY